MPARFLRRARAEALLFHHTTLISESKELSAGIRTLSVMIQTRYFSAYDVLFNSLSRNRVRPSAMARPNVIDFTGASFFGVRYNDTVPLLIAENYWLCMKIWPLWFMFGHIIMR
jgi:hypothetical protein